MRVCSEGREAQICAFDRVAMLHNRADGGTKTRPRILLDSATDDRDAGMLETSASTLLVTTFTSLAYEPVLRRALAAAPDAPHAWRSARLAHSHAARATNPAMIAAPSRGLRASRLSGR